MIHQTKTIQIIATINNLVVDLFIHPFCQNLYPSTFAAKLSHYIIVGIYYKSFIFANFTILNALVKIKTGTHFWICVIFYVSLVWIYLKYIPLSTFKQLKSSKLKTYNSQSEYSLTYLLRSNLLDLQFLLITNTHYTLQHAGYSPYSKTL